MSKQKKKWLRRKAGLFASRIFSSISGKLSLAANYRLGGFLGRIGYRCISRHRNAALTSIRIAYPRLSRSQHKDMALNCFVFMGQSSLELFHMLQNPQRLKGIHIEGKEHLDNALKEKKGIIGLTAHLGNFPLMSLKLASLGYAVNVMARPMRDEKTGDYIHELRTKAGVKAIWSFPRRECIAQTIQSLRDNDIVLIQMDQNFGTGGVWVKFFDKLAATPVGPIIFALRTGACVLPMYITRRQQGEHTFTILPAQELIVTEDKDETVLLNAIAFTKVIEGWIKDNPTQWSWIHRRWKSKPSKKVLAGRFKIQTD